MLTLGIQGRDGIVYEGSGQHGRAVWPAPIITPARIVFESEGPLVAERSSSSITSACRFREDSYDPVTRVRRGRFYLATGTQPSQWYVQPHPALSYERPEEGQHAIHKQLETFQGLSVWNKYLKDSTEQPLVLLGLDDRFTIWTIIGIEVVSTGEELVTLKARRSLGLLPNIDYSKIPEDFRTAVMESVEAFSDEAHRAAPVSVVDRARDTASQITLAYFEATGSAAKDLSDMSKRLADKQLVVAASAATIIGRLHARAKPVERAKRDLRAVREQDAELAIQCVGTILCELGWAEWA